MTDKCRNCGKSSEWTVEDKYEYCTECKDKCICKEPFVEEFCRQHWYFSEVQIEREKEEYISDRQRTDDIRGILRELLNHEIGIDSAVSNIKNLYE